MPWRAQANLILATCCLDTLLGRLNGAGDREEGATELETHLHLRQPHGVTFDAAGVIIDGVIPIHPPALPGAEEKVHVQNHVKWKIRWPKDDNTYSFISQYHTSNNLA